MVAGRVVPGMVVAGSVVTVGIVLDPRTTALITSGGTIVGIIVVAGTVIVYVASPPRSLAGMALPTPELVNGIGKVRVEVFGTSGELEEPYTLPVVPLARV